MKCYILTTVDNPYHPIDEMDKWRAEDYMLAIKNNRPTTESLLATFGTSSIWLTEAENQRIINAAVDDIIRLDELGIYKKIIIDD